MGNTYQNSILDSTLSILSISLLGVTLSFSRQNYNQNLYSLSWCVPKLTTHLGCFVILNQPHTSISFFDYMCSQINHTLVKERQMYAPKNGHLDYGPPLFNLSISWINGLQYFIKSIQINSFDQIVINLIISIFPMVWSFYPKSCLIKRKSPF